MYDHSLSLHFLMYEDSQLASTLTSAIILDGMLGDSDEGDDSGRGNVEGMRVRVKGET